MESMYSHQAHLTQHRCFSTAKAWLRTYGKLNSGDFERMVNESLTQTQLLARAVGLTTSDDIFTIVEGNRI